MNNILNESKVLIEVENFVEEIALQQNSRVTFTTPSRIF
jgi:hypothetical protein